MPSKTRTRRSRGPLRRAARKATRQAKPRRVSKRLAEAPDLRASTTEAALATFAHEVRTPLTGILALSSLLETSELPERERRWVDSIKASAEHLSALATLFVDAARRRTAGLNIRHEFFDLRTLAHAAANSLSGRAAAKGLTATTAIDSALPVFAIGDAVRLRAALENLIDNAVKFTDHGSVAFEATMGRVARKDASRFAVTFAVADSGIGLSLGEIRRLFKPFSQASVAVARRFGGAGLGLSSVRQLAQAMGGDVTVRPRRGGGTIFALTAILERADGPAPEPPSGAQAASVRALKILSVEDNPFGRVVLNAILQELGHDIEFVGRGEDALERLTRGGFDVVLMDIVLPGIDGIEAIKRIRARGGAMTGLPIIGVSGRGDDQAAALAAGANGFLLKPVSPRALATALADAISGR